MTKPNAVLVLADNAAEKIYGSVERRAIATLTRVLAGPISADVFTEQPALLADVEVIFSGWGAPRMDAAFLGQAPNLKAVFYGAGSVRGFTTDALWERGVVVSSAWGANAVPVAEYTLSQIIMSLKKVWQHAFARRDLGREAHKLDVAGAYGSTVALISLGMIGRMVAELLRMLDVEVIAFDPFVTQEHADAQGLGVKMVSLAQAFARADVVSLHTPNLPETRGMITDELFASMKRGATFINTARGAVVDEPAMTAVLQQREDILAILDVTLPEPPVEGSPLYSMPNVVLTPHIAGSMDGECRRMGRYAIDDCRRWIAGEPLQWQVTREMAKTLA